MSGGSYNYLIHKDAGELLQGNGVGDLQAMSDRLAGLGYAVDAARETQEVLLQIRQAQNRIQTSIDRLRVVWRAVEWWDSCDSSESDLKKALGEYRGEQKESAQGSKPGKEP